MVATVTLYGKPLLMVLGALQVEFYLVADHPIANPIGVAWPENPEGSLVGAALTILLLVSGLAAAGSLVIRFRRSRGEERQQLKWFTYAIALLPLAVLADFLPETGGALSLRSPSCSCRSPRASRFCAIGCMTSTG